MITSAYKARAQEVAKLKEASIKTLFLLFLNTGLWLGGTFLFMHLEGTNEAEHKCGVKKVQRDFIESLWHESQSFDEFEWKSSARQKILNFENQIYEAVEAGVSSTSGILSAKEFLIMKCLRSEGVEHPQHVCVCVHHVHHHWIWSPHTGQPQHPPGQHPLRHGLHPHVVIPGVSPGLSSLLLHHHHLPVLVQP